MESKDSSGSTKVKHLLVNILALCICTREAIKLMRANALEEAQIIHISSMAGHKLPDASVPAFNFYCGTKYMVRSITEGLRQELMEENNSENIIRVSCVSPGLTETQFLSRCFNPEIARSVYANTPCLTADNVADAVMYILQTPPTVNINDILVLPTDRKRRKQYK